MGKETKVGLAIVAVLVVFIGIMVARKYRQTDAGKEQVASAGEAPAGPAPDESQALQSPPVVIGTGGTIATPSPEVSQADGYGPSSEPPADALIEESNPNALAEYDDSTGTNWMPARNEPGETDEQMDPVLREVGEETGDFPQGYRAGTAQDIAEHATVEPRAGATDTANEGRGGPYDARPLGAGSDLGEAGDLANEPVHRGGGTLAETGAMGDGASPEVLGGAVASPKVLEPIETRQAYQREAIDPFDRQRWVVQEGDSFWKVSSERYGTGRYWEALADWNKKVVPDPHRMRPGTVLETPPVGLLEESQSESIAAGPVREGNKAAGTFLGVTGEKLYRVGKADTLYGISKKTLGKGDRWKELFDLNTDVLNHPDRLSPGMVLRLPGGGAGEEVLSSRSSPSRFQ